MLDTERLLAWLVQRPPSPDYAWLAELVGGLRPRPGEDDEQPAVQRLDALAARLEGSPELARALSRHLLALFPDRRARHLLAETGVILETGFFAGLLNRLGRRYLPPVPDDRLWLDILGQIFDRRADGRWIAAAGEERLGRLIGLLMQAGQDQPEAGAGLDQLRAEALEALRLLTHRLAALGIAPTLMRYYAPPHELDSPFMAQAAELLAWCQTAQSARPPLCDIDGPSLLHIGVLLDQCDEVLRRVRRMAHEQGTSVALTHLILQAGESVGRIRLLLAIVGAPADAPAHQATARLVGHLVEGECARDSVADLFTRSTDLLALQVTENASRTGEHYVTTDRSEYWSMARSAMGAGVIVGVMALTKILIANLHLPEFWEALGFSLNYAAGFVLIHVLHFTVATKQPAMTAARIAAVISEDRDRKRSLEGLAALTAQISRTQLVAIVGNVVLAFPVALLIAWAWAQLAGSPVTAPAKSAKLLADVHPFYSAALPHAAIAGVCLYLSGIISGFYDNRCVYAGIPQRLARLGWLRRLLGERRCLALAAYVEHNLGAIAGNTAFGFMLGFVGFFGQILGLPLDIRHVTFSAANIAYALVGVDFVVDTGYLAVCVLGIGLVALTNLGVSFALAFNTAVKARRLRLKGGRDFARILWAQFRSSPRPFFLPPREAAPAAIAPPSSPGV
ncbi:MAG TPA: site-specific recombinase [Burkholderiaceae bacterium]|nr:site-specific recombinase [Burkholderiaceae bacterium]